MALRTGVYVVPVNRWYIERTVWLIAGFVLLISTMLALLVNRILILGVLATGLTSIQVSLTGFCPVGNVLKRFGFTGMLQSEKTKRFYRMQTDRWYLERRIYAAVGFNISLASMLILLVSPWWSLFTLFVGGAMVWFAATGFCVMANMLYWIGSEPRLSPQTMPSERCDECGMSGVCVAGHAQFAKAEKGGEGSLVTVSLPLKS